MSNIRKQSDRTRTPESRRRSRDARAERKARERMANLAERAYLAIVEGQAR